jgi:hypothetical protein
MSLGLAPSCGPIIPFSSKISMILAARANPTPSFLWSNVAEAFLVVEITWIALSTSSSSLSPLLLPKSCCPASSLSSSKPTIS